MNRIVVAKELIRLARGLMSMDFPTQDAFDKYMKDHPDADRSNHRVVETKNKKPSKKEKDELPKKEDVENAFRDHLSRTDRTVTKESMKSVLKNQFKGLADEGFDVVWNELVDEKYLIPAKGGYKWEM